MHIDAIIFLLVVLAITQTGKHNKDSDWTLAGQVQPSETTRHTADHSIVEEQSFCIQSMNFGF